MKWLGRKWDDRDSDVLVFLICMVGTAIGIALTLGAPLGVAYCFLVVGGITCLRLMRS